MVDPQQELKGKRIVFDHSDYNDLLGKLRDQMSQKEKMQQLERSNKSGDDAKLVEEWRQRLYEEQQHLARDRSLKFNALRDANDRLLQDRQTK